MLVNNAGIGMRTVNPRFMSEPQPFWEVTPAGFRDVVETKVVGCFLMAREVVPLMLAQGGGRIVNISMNEQTMVRRGLRAVRAVGRRRRGVVAGDGGGPGRQSVTVNILLPGGATLTGMIPDEASAEVRAALLDPAVMGPPIVWLASERPPACTTGASSRPSSIPRAERAVGWLAIVREGLMRIRVRGVQDEHA